MGSRTWRRSLQRPWQQPSADPQAAGLTLTNVESRAPVGVRASFSARGLTAQHIRVDTQQACGFDLQGDTHYLALHDLQTSEAETFADDQPVERLSDLRGRLTYVPPGCRTWGWSRSLAGPQSLTAIYADPRQIEADLAARLQPRAHRVQLYFRHPDLISTFTKLRHCLDSDLAPDVLYVESLCVLALLEWSRASVIDREPRLKGALNARAVARVAAYVEAHLDRDVSLEALAGIVGLSRYHFLRAYRLATRETPYQFLLRRRVERAQELLRDEQRRIVDVASAVGFKTSARLTLAFRKLTNVTPSDFRRSLRP